MDAAIKAHEKKHNITKGDVAAVAIGNAVEFYDFIVYTTFAVMIGKPFSRLTTPFPASFCRFQHSA